MLRSEELQNQLPVDLLTYENFIEVLNEVKKTGLSTSKKQKIIVSLIERIEVFPDRLDIYFAVGRDKIKKELAFAGSLFNFQNVLVESSTSLTNGGTRQESYNKITSIRNFAITFLFLARKRS